MSPFQGLYMFNAITTIISTLRVYFMEQLNQRKRPCRLPSTCVHFWNVLNLIKVYVFNMGVKTMKRAIVYLAVSLVVCLVTCSSAYAANEGYTWDTSTGDATITDGGGTWQNSAGNWYYAASLLWDQNWLNNAAAIFGGGSAGTAGTVSLGSDINAWRLYFNTPNAGNYTIDLAGFSLTLGSATSAININADGTITNSAGTGTLIINGSTNPFLFGGGNLTVAAVISKCNLLALSTGGTLTLTGNNTFTGNIELKNQSQLVIDGAGTLGWNGSEGVYANHIAMYQGADFTYSSIATQTLSGAITDDYPEGQPNTLFKNNTGTLILSGTNTYAGNTTLSGGTLIFAVTNSMSALGAVNVQTETTLGVNLGGVNEWTTGTSGAGTLGGLLAGTGGQGSTVNYSGAVTLEISTANAGGDLTYTNTIANVPGSSSLGITKSGANRLIIEEDGSTYTGLTRVDGGTLKLFNDEADDSWDGAGFEINNGSTLEVESSGVFTLFGSTLFAFDSNGGGTFDLIAGNTLWRNNTIETTGGAKNTVSGSGYFNMQNTYTSFYTVADGTDDVDLEVAVSHERGAIVKSGEGVLALTSANNNMYQPGNTITINAGTIEVAGSGRLKYGNYALDIFLNNDGIFKYSSTAAQTLSGAIIGSGSLEKSGSAVLTLSGTNTYSGATSISDGVLRLAVGGSLSTETTIWITSPGKLQLDVNQTVNALYLDGELAVAGSTWGATGSGAYNIDDTHFAGTGVLTVTTGSPPDGTVILVL